MTYELQQIRDATGTLTSDYGFVRLTGTNDRDAIVAADAAAAAAGQPLWFDGQYYIEDEIERTTPWLSVDDGGTTLWLNYEKVGGVAQSGLSTKTSGAWLGGKGDHGFKLIGQFSSTTGKDAGEGHLGTICRVNEYYWPVAQPIITDMHHRVWMVRAALQRNGSGTISQRSIASIMIAQMAGVEHWSAEVGVFGKTNVGSTTPFMAHWGCEADFDAIGVSGETMTNVGSGYTTPPGVSFTGGTFTSPPIAVSKIEDGEVTGLVFSDWGDVTVPPSVVFTGGGGTGAAATLRFGEAANGYKLPAPIVETYHSVFGTLDFITTLDNGDGHKFGKPFELASVGHVRTSGVKTIGFIASDGIGGALGNFGVGDVANAFTVASQKHLIGKGIHIGAALALDAYAPSGSEHLNIKGKGTAKGNNDFEVGTRIWQQRQLELDAFIEPQEIHFHSSVSPALARAVFVSDTIGRISMPSIRAYGGHRAIEIEYSNADIEVGLTGSDGALIINFSRNVSIVASDTDRGNASNASDTDSYAYGYASPNSRAIEITGQSVTLGALAADVAAGATSITLAVATSRAVNIGDILVIGAERIKVTGTKPPGVTVIPVEPFLDAALTGATVTLDQRCGVAPVKAQFQSSANGVAVLNSDVYDIDLSEVGMTGYHAVKASGDSIIGVRAGTLPQVGRAGGAITGRSTIELNDTSKLFLSEFRALANPRVTSHVRCLDTSFAFVEAGVIEDIANFGSGTGGFVARSSLRDCVDLTGAPVSLHSGSNANGEFRLLEDGTLLCSLRNVTIPIGGYTWTFPYAGHAAATNSVTATSTSTATPRFIGAISSSAANATVQMWTSAGAAVAGAANLTLVGRWRA